MADGAVVLTETGEIVEGTNVSVEPQPPEPQSSSVPSPIVEGFEALADYFDYHVRSGAVGNVDLLVVKLRALVDHLKGA